MILIEIKPGEEVVTSLAQAVANRGITDAAIVSIIGAVDAACVSNMKMGNALDDILTDYTQPMEMSGTGEIRDGKVHIHAVLGAEGDIALAGHLHWARVDTFFVNLYIISLDV